jgi:8-oxo-dGTP pyrophosphatase MutT (NUDIX family)
MPSSIACSTRSISPAAASRADAAGSLKDRILQRLADSRAAADPAGAALARLPAGVAPALFPRPLVPAAVLLPLLIRGGELTVLLTRRTDHLRDHPGQISFPGGRMDPGEVDPRVTALRELQEELGVPGARVEVAGYLPPHAVVTGFVVTPVVGFLPGDAQLIPDGHEVAETFDVPLEFFRDPANLRVSRREVRGVTVPLREFHFGRHRIWGATANILETFITLIEETNG